MQSVRNKRQRNMSKDLTKSIFDNINSMIRYHDNKIQEAFNRFISFSIGIFGGTFWLLSQKEISDEIKENIISSVPLAFWFLGISSLALIYSNWKSWYGFRKAQSKMPGGNVPKPKCPRSCKEQLIMAVIIISVCLFFTCFNPFKI